MKYFITSFLLACTALTIQAQDSLQTKPFKDHFTLDINGSVMLFPFGMFSVPYNVHISPGIKLSKHLAATVSYSNFGREAEYSSKNFAGYGFGLRYDRSPYFLKAEVIQLTRYNYSSDWNSWNLRDKKNLNPMARMHIGFRVAPRFTLGVVYSHFRQVKVIEFGYYDVIGDFTQFRKQLNDSSLQLFFGVSLGKQGKKS